MLSRLVVGIGLTVQDGVYLCNIEEDSPAQVCDLRKGDVVVNVANKTILTQERLFQVLLAHRPGDEVRVEVIRKGQTMVKTMMIGAKGLSAKEVAELKAKAALPKATPEKIEAENQLNLLGIRVGLKFFDNDGAAKVGILAGHVVTFADKQSTKTANCLDKVVRAVEGEVELTLREFDGKEVFKKVQVVAMHAPVESTIQSGRVNTMRERFDQRQQDRARSSSGAGGDESETLRRSPTTAPGGIRGRIQRRKDNYTTMPAAALAKAMSAEEANSKTSRKSSGSRGSQSKYSSRSRDIVVRRLSTEGTEKYMPKWKRELVEKKKIHRLSSTGEEAYKAEQITAKLESESMPDWQRKLLERRRERGHSIGNKREEKPAEDKEDQEPEWARMLRAKRESRRSMSPQMREQARLKKSSPQVLSLEESKVGDLAGIQLAATPLQKAPIKPKGAPDSIKRPVPPNKKKRPATPSDPPVITRTSSHSFSKLETSKPQNPSDARTPNSSMSMRERSSATAPEDSCSNSNSVTRSNSSSVATATLNLSSLPGPPAALPPPSTPYVYDDSLVLLVRKATVKRKCKFRLTKEGELKAVFPGLIKSSKTKYFTVDRGRTGLSELQYWTSQKKKEDFEDCQGSIVLDKAEVVVYKRSSDKNTSFQFDITPEAGSSKDTVVLECSSNEEREQWLDVLEDQGANVHRILKEGFLYKMAERGSNHSKRYFVMYVDKLQYYRKQKDERASHEMSLSGTAELDTVDNVGSGKDAKYLFSIAEDADGDTRMFVLASDNSKVRDSWFDLISIIINIGETNVHPDSLKEDYMWHYSDKRWRKRYVSLLNRGLRVFSDRNTEQDLMVVPLPPAAEVHLEATPAGMQQRFHTFTVAPSGDEGVRMDWFAAKDARSLEQWVKAIAEVQGDKSKQMHENSIREGYLWIQNPKKRGEFHKRYMVLMKDSLRYYARRSDEKPEGEWPVTGESQLDVLQSDNIQRPHSFQLADNADEDSSVHLISAQNSESCESWQDTLAVLINSKGFKAMTSRSIKEGYLYIYNGRSSWSKRYFVLMSDVILAYEHKFDKEHEVSFPIGSGAEVRLDTSDTTGKHWVLNISESGDEGATQLMVACDEGASLMEWVKAVKEARAMHTDDNMFKESLREGYMYITSNKKLQKWSKRYFVLLHHKLLWYKKKNDNLEEGDLLLPNGFIVHNVADVVESSRPLVILAAPDGDHDTPRQYFSALTEDEHSSWLSAMTKLCASKRLKMNPDSLLEGYLEREGGLMDKWNMRYFILTKGQLLYYRKRSDKQPRGIIELDADTDIMVDDDDPLTMDVVTETSKTLLQAPDRATFDTWLFAITSIVDQIATEDDRHAAQRAIEKTRTSNVLASQYAALGVGDEQVEEERKLPYSFNDLLADEAALKLYRIFSNEQYVAENILFYEAARDYRAAVEAKTCSPDEILEMGFGVYSTYIKSEAEYEVNISSKMRAAVSEVFEGKTAPVLDGSEFDRVMHEVKTLMENNSFARFKLSRYWREVLMIRACARLGRPSVIREEDSDDESASRESRGSSRHD